MEDYNDMEPLFFLELPPAEDDFLAVSSEEITLAEETKSPSMLLYPKDRNTEFLNAFPPSLSFFWCNIKQAYRNIYVDEATSQIVIHPIQPHQLINDGIFQQFLIDNAKEIILVARLGYEVHFGIASDLKEIEQRLLSWFNHHIYDTTVVVDVHDFYPKRYNQPRERRICHYNAMIVPKGQNGEAKIYWKEGHLRNLQTRSY